jgi:hypothetical protein
MKPNTLSLKKTALLMAGIFTVLLSFTAAAQKSVYDVIPGSGPKKQGSSKRLPDIINNGENNNSHNGGNSYPVYKHKRKHLPPGQAKKIYGGSAKDYAPGQWKKRHGHHEGHDWDDKDRKYKKHHKHDD